MKLICEKQRVKSDTMIIILDYYSTNAPFYHIRAKERAKYATSLHCPKPSNKVYIIDILIQIKNTCAKTRLTQASEKHDNRKMYQMLGLFQGLLMDHGY